MTAVPLPPATLRLADLRPGQPARVVGLDARGVATPLPPGELEHRLVEMGLMEDAEVEVMHEGFPGRDPLAVRVDQHVLALRRAEAGAVRVVRA